MYIYSIYSIKCARELVVLDLAVVYDIVPLVFSLIVYPYSLVVLH